MMQLLGDTSRQIIWLNGETDVIAKWRNKFNGKMLQRFTPLQCCNGKMEKQTPMCNGEMEEYI